MKKISITLLSLIASALCAQVAIGKASVTNPSVSREFYYSTDNKKAIILPWVDNANTMTNVPQVPSSMTPKTKGEVLQSNPWLDW